MRRCRLALSTSCQFGPEPPRFAYLRRCRKLLKSRVYASYRLLLYQLQDAA